jgi:hypothetical protein
MNGFLQRLELCTNRAYWGDGLLDLFSAVALLALGVTWVAGVAVYGGMAPALLVPIWKPLRQRFTEPRLGMVELAEERQRRNQAFMVLAVVAGFLSLFLGLGVYFAHAYDLELAKVVVKALPGVLVGVAGIATAAALQLRRFYVYGGITVATGFVVAVVPALNPGWAFVAGGVAALIGGLILLRTFARRHPVHAAEAVS